MRPHRVYVVGVAVLAAALCGGCSAHSSKPGTSSAASSAPSQVAVSAVTTTRGNRAVVFALAAQRWTTVPLPHSPADPDAVAGHGSDIYAADLGASGVVLDYSHDGGHSWHSRPVTSTPDLAGVDLALSADGRQLAIGLDRPASAGAVGQADVLVGPAAGGAFARHAAPTAGQLAWWHGRMVLSGGALSSRLYLADATGSTWHAVPVDGHVAPQFDVDPSVPSIGVALTRPDGSLVVPVTSHAGAPSVDLLTTTDGSTFRSLGRVALTGDVGAGAGAAVGIRSDGSVVVSDPNTLRLHVLGAGGTHTVVPKGLPAPPSSLTFLSVMMGLAQVDVAGCADAKSQCTVKHEVFATSDGGASWAPAP
ncbi:MAG TPA: hypothetical protein VH373_09855 [Jatrophihabitantaceae bacterium]|jgi:hypothetical protein